MNNRKGGEERKPAAAQVAKIRAAAKQIKIQKGVEELPFQQND